jgi:ABC-type uncharacterized transport system permease subunit
MKKLFILFILSSIVTVFVIVTPIRPVWYGFLLTVIAGMLNGFLFTCLFIKNKK